MSDVPNPIDLYVPPGALRLSAEALKDAREFIDAVTAGHGQGHIVLFDWATSVTVTEQPGATPQPVNDCLMLGAILRSDVPPDAIQTVDGFDFAIMIPPGILQNSVQRLIDFDKNAYFKFVLR